MQGVTVLVGRGFIVGFDGGDFVGFFLPGFIEIPTELKIHPFSVSLVSQ